MSVWSQVPLRQAALQWLQAQGFFEAARGGLTPQQVYFESTRSGAPFPRRLCGVRPGRQVCSIVVPIGGYYRCKLAEKRHMKRCLLLMCAARAATADTLRWWNHHGRTAAARGKYAYLFGC